MDSRRTVLRRTPCPRRYPQVKEGGLDQLLDIGRNFPKNSRSTNDHHASKYMADMFGIWSPGQPAGPQAIGWRAPCRAGTDTIGVCVDGQPRYGNDPATGESPADIVLRAYREHGDAAFMALAGPFAAVIIDDERRLGRSFELPEWAREHLRDPGDNFIGDFLTSLVNWSNPDTRLIEFPRAWVQVAKGT